jgi:hypothetical protein
LPGSFAVSSKNERDYLLESKQGSALSSDRWRYSITSIAMKFRLAIRLNAAMSRFNNLEGS